MEDDFYKNSFFLVLSNLTTGILGFIFSIILSQLLGAEGMALYGLVMPLYNLFICLMCGGVITAISKLSAVYYDNHDYYNLKKTISSTAIFNIIWALLIAVLVFIFTPQISEYIVKDNRTALALRITVPPMLFICMSNILKGFFYGTSNILVPAIIDIGEKAIRIAIIILLLYTFGIRSLEKSVAMAYTALAIGEFISLALLYIYYKKYTSPLIGVYKYKENRLQLIFNVLMISFPLCLNSLSTTALDALATLILPRRLVASGMEYSIALGSIGKLISMSMNIVIFPMIIIGSISTLLIPDLSKMINKKDYYMASQRIKEVLKIALILGLCTFAIAFNIPNDIGYMFYKRYDLGSYIKIAALCPPIVFMANSTLGILNGLGRQKMILKNSILTSLIDLLCLYSLGGIPKINVFAFVIGMISSSIILFILNFREISSCLALDINPLNIAYVFIIGAVSFIAVRYISSFSMIPKWLCILTGFAPAPLAVIAAKKK